ncbi:MAG: enoyl-CoA hydratase/isomerase family protein [Methylocystaceae bacterium]
MDIRDWLLYEKEGSIAIITLNQPAKLNTFSWLLLEDLEKIQLEMAADDSLRAAVIKASGKHFSAGMSLDDLQITDVKMILKRLAWWQNINLRWQEMPFPIVAAVQGHCIGGGIELLLGCDIRIAADNAHFRMPEVALGLAPDVGGTTRLSKLIGPGQAKRLIMTNEEIDAQEAARIGLVEIVVPIEELQTRAMNMAQKMASMPPIAMRWAKKGANLAMESSTAAGLMFEQAQSVCCFMTEDLQEGLNAFVAKREPEFKGQ